MRAVGPAREAVAVGADHDAVLQHDAMADDDALTNRGVGVNQAVVADLGEPPDADM